MPLLVLALIALPAPAQGDEPTLDQWLIERHEWRQETPGLAHLSVRNLHGDVRIRPSAGSEIYLLGLVQHHVDDSRMPDFEVREEGGELALEVTYPAGDLAAEPEAWKKRRVDVTVLVPAAVTLAIETDHGLAEVKGTTGDLTVRTTFGEIVTVTSGSVDAESVHGPIRSELRNSHWNSPPRFATINGEIRVQLPRTVAASARLETRGEITTDFSLAVTRDPATGHKVARAEIGLGGQQLSATSVNGAIKLLQSITGY
jgi:hypothetical protein